MDRNKNNFDQKKQYVRNGGESKGKIYRRDGPIAVLFFTGVESDLSSC